MITLARPSRSVAPASSEAKAPMRLEMMTIHT
jgi:hypothetical protein